MSRSCLGGFSVVSRWCFGGVSVVSRLFLGGFWVVFRLCLGGVLVFSRWCLHGVPVVSWWFVLGVLCFLGGVSMVSRLVVSWFLGGGNLVVSRGLDGVREVSLWSLAAFWVISRWSLAIVSCWIVAGLLLVSSWFLFLTKLARLSILNWRQRIETRHFAIRVVCWVNFCSV